MARWPGGVSPRCPLPPTLDWFGVLLAACLGGIGFTMSIFIATLACPAPGTPAAAKLGVLLASIVAGLPGILVGRAYLRRNKAADQATAPGAAQRAAAR